MGGALGDQQAALFGHTCFAPGEAKNTYGTGCFLLFNTGHKIIFSRHGLLTTPAYQMHGKKPVYALEGSIAYAGALVQWVRHNLGLFAPHWRPDARGVIAGLTQFATKGHIARAVLEATAYQTKDIVEAVSKDLGRNLDLPSLKVDGGMVENHTLMQFQADILDKKVIRPKVTETTALGAAYAAGLAVGFWPDTDSLKEKWQAHTTWYPHMDDTRRTRLYDSWQKAVKTSLGWC